ncbi:proteoglycan 4-like isoform X2 [Hippoglossus stenolepis]|uniref:proteoglycan 4-like isoform X2 n=1 Tax=Hippoglossus stenolepis TaxID=195615 RepID=UPI001FAFECDC|nr:proteoglycan 4-like isoform X2 [Hippoglossus stenolepis]
MYQGLIAEDEEEVEHFIDLLKKMLKVNKNERITPAQVLKHPFLAVEQHGDGPHMTVTMEEPYVPQQPEPLTSEEVYPSPPKTTSLDLEDEEVTAAPVQPTVPQQPEPLTSEEVYPSTPGINVSSNLEDEEETTASVQPEVVTKSRRKSASRRVRTFFKRVKKAWCSCFNCCTKMP